MSYPLRGRRTAVATPIVALRLLDEKELTRRRHISGSLFTVARKSNLEKEDQILPKKSTYLTPCLGIYFPHLRHDDSLPCLAVPIDSGERLEVLEIKGL